LLALFQLKDLPTSYFKFKISWRMIFHNSKAAAEIYLSIVTSCNIICSCCTACWVCGGT